MKNPSKSDNAQPTMKARISRVLVETALRNPRLLSMVPDIVRRKFGPGLVNAMYEGTSASKLSQGELKGTAGVNVIGLLESPKGVGEQARSLIRSLEAVNIPVHPFSFTENQLAGKEPFDSGGWPHAVNLCVVNADNIRFFVERIGTERFQGRFNIGYWAWELERFPESWDGCADFLNEIWVLSSFIQSSVSARVKVPVVRMPGGISPPKITEDCRSLFGIPAGRKAILGMFDFDSRAERKNPMAILDVVEKCQSTANPPFLVLKSGGRDVSSLS